MEETKSFSVKQTQADSDSGYSCTSTQSKSSRSDKSCQSQRPSTAEYNCFKEQSSTILTTAKDGEMSTLNAKPAEQSNQSITNQKPNDASSKSVQNNTSSFKSQSNQLFRIDEFKHPALTSKMESGDSKNINDNIKADNGQENTTFFQLSYLCQSYRDLNQVQSNSNPSNKLTIIDTLLKVLNEQDLQFKEILESNDVLNDSFGVIVSMTNGLIIKISNSIQKSMGYPKDMWQDRSFIDFIHPNDRTTFVSYMTSILTDPCTISRGDGLSTVTYLRPKTNDGFYCNMGFSISESQNYYQVCKLTITFKDLSYVSTTSSLAQIGRPQLLLVVKAQLIRSAYTCSKEKLENPIHFMTKHNALFEWCYVDNLITSYFGYLPQNIIGRSIFDFYSTEDLMANKEIHENLIKSESRISLIGNPYRFKCQNGDFALVETEWSNFVNPWSGRIEFVVGKHKIIQGPVNPDVTTLAVPQEIVIKDKYSFNEIPKDFEKIPNENNEDTGDSYETNQSMDLNTNSNQKMSIQSTLCRKCFVHPSIQVSVAEDALPDMPCSYSDHDSTIFGCLPQHFIYESKSSSNTLLSYTELNYNDNIQRFFNSKVNTSSSEDSNCSKKLTTREVLACETDTNKVQPDSIPLLQRGTLNSSMIITQTSPSHGSEQSTSKNCQLTQKMLLRHNKKMEDDLVNQHKQNKSCNKQNQNLSDQTLNILDITRGLKRNNSSANENKSCKLTKRKCLTYRSDLTNEPQPLEYKDIATAPTAAKSTQIWSICQITRDSQTMTDLPPTQYLPTQCQIQTIPNQGQKIVLPSQELVYNAPLSNNVMSVQNECKLMEIQLGYNQDSLSNQLQSLNMPSHISENPQTVHDQQQLCMQQLYQNIENKTQVPLLSKTNNRQNIIKNTNASRVNRDEVITSSDSDCKREIGSFRSSSGWMYEDSSFYSSSLRDKTESSEREDYSLVNVFEKTCYSHQLIQKQPFWMEDIVSTPDLVFRYQMDYGDVNEVFRKDINTLNTFTQPLLVSEQLKQLCVEIDVNGTSKTSHFEDGTSSSSDGDECYISIGKNKRRRIDFCRMAMIYEENALIPPPTTSPRNKLSKMDQSTL